MDLDPAIMPPISSPQVCADPSLRILWLGVIAQVQDTLPDVAEDGFHRVVVRTSLGQGDPVQLQFPHQAACLPALARVGPVLIQGQPNGDTSRRSPPLMPPFSCR